jgi:pimeloyl-ACP methyl ester carboxylesterase
MGRSTASVVLATVLWGLAACIPLREENLKLGTTREAARVALRDMREHSLPVARPVVVLNGYHGFPTIANRIARKLRAATSDDPKDFLAISYFFGTDIDAMTQQVFREVEARWPSADPEWTTEVDVVGISMGGLIARWAELRPEERVRKGRPAHAFESGKRLRIKRLFTLGSPHRGATMAEWLRLDSAAADMRAGSPFLAALDERWEGRGYELVSYAQMRDLICGGTRCAPPGTVPIWTSGTVFFSHLDLADNPVFLADIAGYLRGLETHLVPSDPPPRD